MPPFHFSDDVEKKPLTWQYIRKVAGNVIHYYHPHIGLFRLSVGCALVNSGLTILVPLLVYRAFQIYLPAKNYPMIWAVIGAILILMILTSAASYINVRFGHVLGTRMEADMRNDLFRHLQKLSFSYFDREKTGHIMSRITNDLTMIAELAHHGPEDLLSSTLMFIGGCAGFLVYNFYPARVFMGDTGSLFLGGLVVGGAFMMENPLLVIVYGFWFILETASVMLQVGYFKLTHGKRIFKMAPIHHHFEKCGWSEWKVFAVFSSVSLAFALLTWFCLRGRYGV